jgi:hypothetical protein
MTCLNITPSPIRCNNEPKIKSILIIKASDARIENGKVVLKRKYGKFKRPVYKWL